MGNTMDLGSAEVGRVIRCRGAEWTVSDKTVSRQSDSYIERQWTLTHGSDELYLVKSEEKKAGGLEEIWVLTRQISLSGVSYEYAPGNWRGLDEDALPPEPPRAVQYAEADYNYDSTSSVKARDDDGNMVPKDTWDFYSADRRKNLAIEIWKEDDKDYPEAYLGDVVTPGDFEVLDKKVATPRFGIRADQGFLGILKSSASGIGIVGLMLVINGFPCDYFIALAVPAALLLCMYIMGSPAWLTVSCVCVWGVVGAAAWLSGFGLSFWYLAFSCAALSVVLPRLMTTFSQGTEISGHWRLAAFGVLPALWVYSFLVYIIFAPGPHAAYQFLAACLLPLAIAAAAAVLNRVLEGSDGRP
jgi:hypothetical protein